MTDRTNELDIRDIIAQRRVRAAFQPIVSIRKRAVLGFEALSRGRLEPGGVAVPPCLLFGLTQDPQSRLELDRLCRDKALEAFAPAHANRKDLLLTLNMDAAILDSGLADPGYLARQAAKWRINPNNVVIEIIESHVAGTDNLLSFIGRYRELGFLIALDDVGTGHSNLERVALIKPDVMKLDRSLIHQVHEEFYKQQVARCLVALARRIGAMLVAEGVEDQEEALFLMELGVDAYQGFHFSRPGHMDESGALASERMKELGDRFRDHMLRGLLRGRARHGNYKGVLARVLNVLEGVPEDAFDRALADALSLHEDLECLYVLDRKGRQVSQTICNPDRISMSKRFIYQPAAKGADHSLKEYFLPISAGLDRFVSEPYVSLASGNLCLTMVARFTGREGGEYVLCVDVAEAG